MLGGFSAMVVAAAASEAAAAGLCATDGQAMARLLATHRETSEERIAALAGLHDELTPHVRGAPREGKAQETFERAKLEYDIYAAFVRANPDINYRDPERFARNLLEVHRRCRSGANAFRRSSVRIAAEDGSEATIFPDWRSCAGLIAEIAGFISAHVDKWPATCAMVAYGGIIHTHPFSDGNGRTARIMHNLVLHSAGYRHFVPISLVASRSGGSLIVKLRRLILGNDWGGLQRFLLDSYTLSQEWQREALGAEPAGAAT